MDAIQVDYSVRTKEASNSEILAKSISKAPTKYVFKPEVVKSLPKYSYHASVDSKDRDPPKSVLLGKEQRSSNGLRGLFGRITRHSSENKSLERDSADRKRSRSLFLAHDHSKDNAKLSEHRVDHFCSPRRRKSGEDRRGDRRSRNVPEVKRRQDQKDQKLKNVQGSDKIGDQLRISDINSTLSKHRQQNDRNVERHRTSPDHLETCQEEYRKNGKLCCSTERLPRYEDRCNPASRSSEKKCQQSSPVKEVDRQQQQLDEVINREWSSPRHRSTYNFGSERQKPQVEPYPPSQLRTRSLHSPNSLEEDKNDTGRPLRRLDSPYPSTNHVDNLSPSSDVLVADLRSSSSCKSIQDDVKQTTLAIHSFAMVTTQKECVNCGIAHSPAPNNRNDYSKDLLKSVRRHEVENHIAKNKYIFEKRTDCTTTPTVTGLLYRSRSLPQLSVHDSGVASGNEQTPGRPTSRLVADLRQLLTLKQHYYPEGGWGWVIVVVGVFVQILSHGMHGAAGVLIQHVAVRFGSQVYLQSESGWGWVVVVTGVMVQILAAGIHGAAGIWLAEGMRNYRQPLVNVGWLGAMSTGVALLVSPVTIAFCRKKSTRVTAVLGGLVTALGCLFTSFASQFHQLFFSYGTVVGIGVGMTRDCSTLMVAQYFKRRREFVEIFIVSGSGLGIAVMSAFIKGAISKIGWRLGLQAVTGVVFLTFILGTFYRSASLYHPQRRAILHLKNQKRKIKDKNKVDDRPPFFDFSTLKSKTVRILLVSTGISAFGINTPIFYLAHQAEEEGLGDTVILLQAYLGLAWTLGCVAFGLLVVHHSVECRIARQYLTQAAVFMCGLCILALTAVHGNYHGYVMFTWIYGIFCGGYHYSLKMYTYERVRARNFARTWGFVQCSQAIPIAIGVPISGYMNVGCGGKAGYYFSSTCVLVGSFTLFFIDLHRRNLSRHKHTRANGTRHLCVSDNCPQRRRLSFTQEPENEGAAAGAAAAALVLGAEFTPGQGEIIDALGADKPELTCISEEGIADMDLPDNLLDDLDYIGDCITSCNKVENYLMLSEFENNLIAEMPIIMDRKGRRWSLARSKQGGQGSQGGNGNGNSQAVVEEDDDENKPKWRLAPAPPNNRVITVIDEAST